MPNHCSTKGAVQRNTGGVAPSTKGASDGIHRVIAIRLALSAALVWFMNDVTNFDFALPNLLFHDLLLLFELNLQVVRRVLDILQLTLDKVFRKLVHFLLHIRSTIQQSLPVGPMNAAHWSNVLLLCPCGYVSFVFVRQVDDDIDGAFLRRWVPCIVPALVSLVLPSNDSNRYAPDEFNLESLHAFVCCVLRMLLLFLSLLFAVGL